MIFVNSQWAETAMCFRYEVPQRLTKHPKQLLRVSLLIFLASSTVNRTNFWVDWRSRRLLLKHPHRKTATCINSGLYQGQANPQPNLFRNLLCRNDPPKKNSKFKLIVWIAWDIYLKWGINFPFKSRSMLATKNNQISAFYLYFFIQNCYRWQQ